MSPAPLCTGPPKTRFPLPRCAQDPDPAVVKAGCSGCSPGPGLHPGSSFPAPGPLPRPGNPFPARGLLPCPGGSFPAPGGSFPAQGPLSRPGGSPPPHAAPSPPGAPFPPGREPGFVDSHPIVATSNRWAGKDPEAWSPRRAGGRGGGAPSVTAHIFPNQPAEVSPGSGAQRTLQETANRVPSSKVKRLRLWPGDP